MIPSKIRALHRCHTKNDIVARPSLSCRNPISTALTRAPCRTQLLPIAEPNPLRATDNAFINSRPGTHPNALSSITPTGVLISHWFRPATTRLAVSYLLSDITNFHIENTCSILVAWRRGRISFPYHPSAWIAFPAP
jgi:hypothetical protein